MAGIQALDNFIHAITPRVRFLREHLAPSEIKAEQIPVFADQLEQVLIRIIKVVHCAVVMPAAQDHESPVIPSSQALDGREDAVQIIPFAGVHPASQNLKHRPDFRIIIRPHFFIRNQLAQPLSLLHQECLLLLAERAFNVQDGFGFGFTNATRVELRILLRNILREVHIKKCRLLVSVVLIA